MFALTLRLGRVWSQARQCVDMGRVDELERGSRKSKVWWGECVSGCDV